MSKYKQDIERFDKLKSDRSVWNNHWQILGEYVHQNKQNFEATQQAGEFLSEDIFDSSGTFAAHNASSTLLGMLWPSSAKQAIEITPPDDLEITTELSNFYQRMTDRTVAAMDDPLANLMLSLDEYMLDQLVFGTSGVGVEKGSVSKLMYTPYGVKELYIEEGKGGAVSEIYLFFEWRLNRVVAEYGVENLSEKLRKKYEQGKRDECVKILVIIRPREKPKAKKGVLSMPIEALHLEYVDGHLLKESGFNEMPIPVARFRKLNYERYGRSPAMMALPDIREANALRESVIVATEKVLDMPKGVLSDGVFGGGTIDTSAKAINVFNDTGNGAPIFDIGTPPDINAALARLEELKQSISQHFNIDRLLDFNNEAQMTFGEAQIRNQIRTASLASLFARQITEFFTPLIARSVNILFRDGEFGVIAGSEEEAELLEQGIEDIEYIPDALVKRLERGDTIYEVRYKTQAAQASKAEDYIAIVDVLNLTSQLARVNPAALDRIDFDEAIKQIAKIRAIPAGIVKEDDLVNAERKAAQEREQAMMKMEQAQAMAGMAKDVAPMVKAAQEQ